MNPLTNLKSDTNLVYQGLVNETLVYDKDTQTFLLADTKQDISVLESNLVDLGRTYIHSGHFSDGIEPKPCLHRQFLLFLDKVCEANSNIRSTIYKVKDAFVDLFLNGSLINFQNQTVDYLNNYRKQKFLELTDLYPNNFGYYDGRLTVMPADKDFVVLYGPFQTSHYHVQYRNFYGDVCFHAFDVPPKKEQIDKLLQGLKARRTLELYQSRPDAIPFHFVIPDAPLKNGILNIQYKDNQLAVLLKCCSIRDGYTVCGCPFNLDNYIDVLKSFYELLADSPFVATNKLLTTNSTNLSGEVPRPIEGVEMESLIQLFQQINFVDPQEPGFLDPSTLTTEGKKASLHELAKSLIFFISNLRLSKHINLVAVPRDPQEQIQFKTRIRAYLTHIISALLNDQNVEIRNDIVYQIAESGKLCGRRWQNIVNKIYTEYILGKISSSENVEEFFLECSDRLKTKLIEEMVKENDNDQSAHDAPVFIKTLYKYGVDIPGHKAFENDDVNDELVFDGVFKSELDVFNFFAQDFLFSSFYEIIEEALKKKFEETRYRFLGNLLTATYDQLFNELANSSLFQEIDRELREEIVTIRSSLSPEIIQATVDTARATFQMAFARKKTRFDAHYNFVQTSYLDKLQEIYTELKTLATAHRADKVMVDEEVETAISKYEEYMLDLANVLIEKATNKYRDKKIELCKPILKQRNYFSYDAYDTPTGITKEGVKNLLLHFNLIEKKSDIMQD